MLRKLADIRIRAHSNENRINLPKIQYLIAHKLFTMQNHVFFRKKFQTTAFRAKNVDATTEFHIIVDHWNNATKPNNKAFANTTNYTVAYRVSQPTSFRVHNITCTCRETTRVLHRAQADHRRRRLKARCDIKRKVMTS